MGKDRQPSSQPMRMLGWSFGIRNNLENIDDRWLPIRVNLPILNRELYPRNCRQTPSAILLMLDFVMTTTTLDHAITLETSAGLTVNSPSILLLDSIFVEMIAVSLHRIEIHLRNHRTLGI